MATGQEDSSETGQRKMKIAVLGASSVGKTSFIKQFMFGDDNKASTKPMQDFYSKEVEDDDGNPVQVDILDSTIDFEYPQVMKLTIQTGDAFVLMFAIDDKTSFEKLHAIKDMIVKEKKKHDKKVCIIVIGNKTDLETRTTSREISEAVVNIDWGCYYLEISTRAEDTVNTVFKEVVWRYYNEVGGSAASGLRRMTSPGVIMKKLKRKLTLRRQKSFL